MSLTKCLLKVGDGLSEEERRIYDASVQDRVGEGYPLEEAQQLAAQDRMSELSEDASEIADAVPDNALLEQIALEREWLRWTPPVTKDGKYLGAPQWVKSKADIAKLSRHLRARTREGVIGRHWYSQSTKSIVEAANGNLQDAVSIINLLAIYSPQANIYTNVLFALKAWNQYKNGLPIKVKTGAQDLKATEMLYDGKPFDGRKISNFYTDLIADLFETHPDAIDGLNIPEDVKNAAKESVTIDVWMLRAFGYSNEGTGNDKGSGQYSFSESFTKQIAAKLNKELKPGEDRWTPRQVQAAVWTAMKARYELPEVKDATWRESNRKGVTEGHNIPTTADGIRKHRAIWRKQAMKVTSSEAFNSANTNAADFGDVFKRLTQTVTWEAYPSTALGYQIEDVDGLTAEARNLIVDENGVDQLAVLLGSDLSWINPGKGAYQGDVNYNNLSFLLPPKESGEFNYDMVRTYASAIQYIFKQEAVPWFRPEGSVLTSKKAADERLFRVVGPTGKVVPKSKVETLSEAQAIADKKGEGYEVRGGKYAHGISLTFGHQLTLADEQKLTDIVGDYTKVSDTEIAVINYRDDNTKVPFVDDEVWMQNIGNGHDALLGMGMVDSKFFYSEGEYGYEHDWSSDPEGSAVLDKGGISGRSDLQQWVLDRRKEFDEILSRYDGVPGVFEQQVVRYGSDLAAGVSRHPETGIPIDEQGRVPLTHWGAAGLNSVDPTHWGSASAGREKARVGPDFRPRSYFGLPGYIVEINVNTGSGGRYFTTVDPSDLYNIDEDPRGFREEVIAANPVEGPSVISTLLENRIVDEGFKGYWGNLTSGPIAVLFEAVPVEQAPRYHSATIQPGTPLSVAGVDIDGNLPEIKDNEEEVETLTTAPAGSGRGTYSILGDSISRDFRKKGVSTLLGKKIKNSQDLATLAQIYRDPRYETLRYFITNDAGEVVYQTGVTSRLPAYSAAIVGEPETFLDTVQEQATAAGGTKVWMLHNHPSGNVTPSAADERLSFDLFDRFRERGLSLESHVIINHKRYTTIEDGETRELDVDVDYDINEPSVPHPVLGETISDPKRLMEIGKNLEVNDDHLVVIGRKGAEGKVSLLAEITTMDLSPTKMGATLRKLAVDSGSAELFLYGVPSHLSGLAQIGIEQGFVRDVILKEPDGSLQSMASSTVTPQPGLKFGKAPRQTQVAEYTPTDSEYVLQQSAWHGTPHIFDRFSLKAMGAGEGNQAYGWGLYFAQKREIAEWYRDRLTGKSFDINRIAKKHGLKFEARTSLELVREASTDKPVDRVVQYLQRSNSEMKTVDAKTIRSIVESYRSQKKGNLFQAKIPEDSELLDWDKPIKEQSKTVRESLKSTLDDISSVNSLALNMRARGSINDPNITGADVYRILESIADADQDLKGDLLIAPGGPKSVSLYLNSLGIPGLRYLDGTSRQRGEGAYNYVIWDEERVTIEAVNDEMLQAEQLEQGVGPSTPPRATFDLQSHLIKLGAASDLSSFLHESSHLFLVMEQFYAEKFGITEDQRTILDWLGVKSFDEIKRDHHEKWAETFEVYLREGKAPSLSLREAFAAFGRWLTRIYQELTDSKLLRADLTTEIKEVFDRMLASQAEIEAAMADPAYDVMFRSKEEAGMTEAEWAKYQRNQERRVNKTQATVDEKLIKELRKRRAKEWNEEKAPIVEKITEDLEKEPVYRLMRDLKNFPMDWQAVKELTGAKKISDLKLQPGMMKNDGIDPVEYADLYGYDSVTSMIEDMKQSPPIKQAAGDLAESIMVAKYGDILNDGTIEAEAQEAAHNDAQAALLVQELRAVDKKTTINREYLKAEARAIISKMGYKEIKPSKYYAAEIRAAQKAVTAETPADKAAAKIQQLANHYLYREAVEVKRRMERHRRYIRRVQTREYSSKDVDKQTIGAMKVLANMFEMRSDPEQVLAMTEVLQWYDTQVNSGVDVTLMLPELVVALEQRSEGTLVNMARLPEFDDLSAETVQGVYEMLRHMRYVGGKLADRKKSERGARAEKFAEWVKEKGGKDVKDRRGERVPGADWKREFQKFLNGFPSLRNLVRKLDGFDEAGSAMDLIYRKFEDAQSRKMALNAEIYDRFEEELGDLYRLGINHKKAGRKDYRLQNGTVRTLTSEQRLMMAVYWGTESSREAIREGYSMTDADVARVMSDLTVEQLNLVNAVWKVNESMWPDLASAAIARHGVAPPKLDATPFVVNGVKMTGGHMRLFYDSQALELKNEQENAGHNLEVMPSKAGSLHARIGSGGKPVLLDKNNIARQLNEVTHYIAFAEVAEDVRSVVNHQSVKDAIETKHGIGFYEALIENLDGISGNRAERETLKFVARLSRWARRAATAKHLMFSPRNTIQQIASLPIVMKEVGPVKAAGAFLRLANPETRKDLVKFINGKSKFMENRASVVNREASEFIGRMQASGKAEHVWNEFAKYGFAPQTIVDSFFAYPTWLAAYENSMELHGDETRAASDADTAVAESVGSGSDLHLGGMFQQNRSEFHKMLTVFGSWFNNYYQRVYKATEAGTKIDMNAATEITLLPFTVAVLSSLLVMDEPEDDEPVVEWAGKRYVGFMAGMVPLLRDVASTFSGFTPSMPITSLLEIPYQASQIPAGEKTGLKRSINAAKVVTSAVPIPGSGAIIRVLDFIESDMKGKEKGDWLWYQAIVEGKDRN